MTLQKLAALYRSVSEPVRLKILEFLMTEECCCICKIAEHTKRDQSVVFRHIQALKKAGLVDARKQNKFLMCKIKDKKKAEKLLEG